LLQLNPSDLSSRAKLQELPSTKLARWVISTLTDDNPTGLIAGTTSTVPTTMEDLVTALQSTASSTYSKNQILAQLSARQERLNDNFEQKALIYIEARFRPHECCGGSHLIIKARISAYFVRIGWIVSVKASNLFFCIRCNGRYASRRIVICIGQATKSRITRDHTCEALRRVSWRRQNHRNSARSIGYFFQETGIVEVHGVTSFFGPSSSVFSAF
jgi:hypothetical protein